MLETALAASLLTLVHVAARRLQPAAGPPRKAWLSAAGGVAVAYVFVHLLPQLHAGQHVLQEVTGSRRNVHGPAGLYLVALAGLVGFHGLERLAASSRSGERQRGNADRAGGGVFAVHVASFALYNMAIGYLLVHGPRDDQALYALAMGLHLLANDQALREHHKDRYDRVGRWVLAAAVVAGWAAGLRYAIPELAILLLLALLAGGVILNVMKEEVPPQRESRFGAFLAGALGYSALLLAA